MIPDSFDFASARSRAKTRFASTSNSESYVRYATGAINIGLESADQETLDDMGKPLKRSQVIQCFGRMQSLNGQHDNIECTANFLFDEKLPAGHIPAFLDLVGDISGAPKKQRKPVSVSTLPYTPFGKDPL